MLDDGKRKLIVICYLCVLGIKKNVDLVNML